MSDTIGISRVALSFEGLTGGPGPSEITGLYVGFTPKGIMVRHVSDHYRVVMEKRLPPGSDWRVVVKTVIDKSWHAWECEGNLDDDYPWPDQMECDGSGIFSELVRLAWAGPPVWDIASALGKMPDSDVKALWTSMGPFTERPFIRYMLGISEKTDLGSVLSRLTAGRIDRAEIRRVLAVESALRKAQKRLADAQHAWDMCGFEQAVDAALATWRSNNPSTSGNAIIGRATEANALESFLTAYVAQHRALPRGSHQLVATYGSSSSWTFQVNFDQFVGTTEGW